MPEPKSISGEMGNAFINRVRGEGRRESTGLLKSIQCRSALDLRGYRFSVVCTGEVVWVGIRRTYLLPMGVTLATPDNITGSLVVLSIKWRVEAATLT